MNSQSGFPLQQMVAHNHCARGSARIFLSFLLTDMIQHHEDGLCAISVKSEIQCHDGQGGDGVGSRFNPVSAGSQFG
ncbi:hypothetical protein DKK68_00955 [Bifidobacterium asteroides]|nr:hypothetical protein DKK68_00955 [Bifidobacterium asteroides]